MSTTIEPRVIHAFARDGGGGNPAGVVLDADGLDAAQRQAIATGLGVTETAFVSRSAMATRRVEFFTPTRQIAHCGHATVAAFGWMHLRGDLGEGDFSKETIDGQRTVRIRDGQVFLRLPSPRIVAGTFDRDALARLLGIAPSAIDADASGIADLGNRFLHIRIADAVSLRAIAPDHARIESISDSHDLIGVYAYTRDTDETRIVARTRMFAPRYGIVEESATGMAAAGLAAWLAGRGELGGDQHWIQQGDAMPNPSPSLLEVRVERGTNGIAAIWVGGTIADAAGVGPKAVRAA